MTAQVKSHHSIVNAAVDMLGKWLKHRQEIREIRNFSSAEFASIARELCVTPADLDRLVRKGPDAVRELPKLLKALDIDEMALSRTEPLVLRDMERVCAFCQRKARCGHDLDAGTLAQDYLGYCPNAPTIAALGGKS